MFVKTFLYLDVKIYIMATHGKVLYNIDVKGIRNGKDLTIGVYGIFNTEKVIWTYFVISWVNNAAGNMILTDDISYLPYSTYEATYESIRKFGKSVQTVQDGEKYCQEFKMKWESGSNNTTAEMRDKKLDELLK